MGKAIPKGDFLMSNRTGIFIDGGYLNQILKDFNNPPINYEKFSHELCGRELFRTYYYHAMPFLGNHHSLQDTERFRKANCFYTNLRNIPKYEVRLGKLICIHNNGIESFIQKQVDMLITIDLLNLSFRGRINKAIIVTGDSDFVPLIEVIKDEGIQVCLFHGNKYAKDLWEICDVRHKIDATFISKCERK